MNELEERIFVDAYKESLREVEYVGHMEKNIKLGRDIMDKLGPDGSITFLRYEMSVCLANGIYLEKAYQLGLRDGDKSKCWRGGCAETCLTKCPTKHSVI